MGRIYNFLKKVFGYNTASTPDAIHDIEKDISETTDISFLSISIDWESLVRSIIEDGYTIDHFDGSDLRILAGDKILTIIYDRGELGLHSFGIYDYCTTSDKEGHKLMAQIIRDNEDEAYESLLIKISDKEVCLNIADCTNRGGGQHVDDQMIEVFEPVILKFVQDNAVLNNVGLVMSYEGTSYGAHYLCERLKATGLNIHLAFIESWPIDWIRNKIASVAPEIIELCRSYKVFQSTKVENFFDEESIKNTSRGTILEALSYLKSVIS